MTIKKKKIQKKKQKQNKNYNNTTTNNNDKTKHKPSEMGPIPIKDVNPVPTTVFVNGLATVSLRRLTDRPTTSLSSSVDVTQTDVMLMLR